MTAVNLYLNFNGNTEEAFRFYQSIFGGEFSNFQRFKEVPGTEELPPGVADKIMHIALPVGNIMLHATDALESMGHPLTVGNNFNIMLEPDSQEETEKLFAQLSAGGKVTMPLQDTFWGAYYGSFIDRFGVPWMVNYDKSSTV
jgi:PhnB protein